MGCAQSAEEKHDKLLQKQLKTAQLTKPKKLLLLGAGRAGKSTIFKQVRRIHNQPYSETERRAYVAPIRSNVILACKVITADIMTLPAPTTPAQFLDKITIMDEGSELTPALARTISQLWQGNDSEFRDAAKRRGNDIGESAMYFLNKVEELATPKYTPSEEDLIRVRVRTSGIVENHFSFKGNDFQIVDVGGQRGERRKWIHCFDDVDAVLFVAAMSEFDQTLAEDSSKNSLEEALELFKSVVNFPAFAETSMILFLNKKDIFAEKLSLQQQSLADVFHDFDPNYKYDYDMSVEFLIDEFLDCRQDTEKNVYYHVTCATDKNNIEFVFKAVTEIVLLQNLKVNNLA